MDLLDDIQIEWRRRQYWHRAEKSLTLAGKAVCRGDPTMPQGDDEAALKANKEAANKLFERIESFYLEEGPSTGTNSELTVMPLLSAREPLVTERESIEKKIEKLGKRLPIAPWIKETYGLGYLLAAAVCAESVGEDADSPGDYRTPAGLWSRFGVAVKDGKRQRKVKGKISGEEKKRRKKGEVAEVAEGEEQGYSPSRRSLLWNVGNGLIGGMGRGPRLPVDPMLARIEYAALHPYQRLFVDHMRAQAAKHPEFRLKDKVRKKDGVVVESYSKHCFNRAKSYVEKRFLLHLWKQWRRAVDPRWVDKPWMEAA